MIVPQLIITTTRQKLNRNIEYLIWDILIDHYIKVEMMNIYIVQYFLDKEIRRSNSTIVPTIVLEKLANKRTKTAAKYVELLQGNDAFISIFIII